MTSDPGNTRRLRLGERTTRCGLLSAGAALSLLLAGLFSPLVAILALGAWGPATILIYPLTVSGRLTQSPQPLAWFFFVVVAMLFWYGVGVLLAQQEWSARRTVAAWVAVYVAVGLVNLVASGVRQP